MEHNPLIENKIGPTMLKFAIPFMIARLLQALYGAADMFVVGQYANSEAIAAVSIGSQIIQTVTGIVFGLSMGGTVLIGQAIGRKDGEAAAQSIGNLALVFLALAALVTPLMIAFTDLSVDLMQTPVEALEPARAYTFICACGIPFIIGYNAVSGIFRGLGDSRTPVIFIAIACVTNVVLDFVLVGGFRMGAAGAAIATVAAQAVSFLFSLLYIRRKGFAFPFGLRHFSFEKSYAYRILRYGIPLAFQDILIGVSFLVITAVINTMGLIAAASVGVVEKLISFAMLPASAFSSAVATMTAQNYGAGRTDRAWKSLLYGIGYSLIFGVIVTLWAQFWPQSLTAIFSNDQLVIEGAAEYLRSYAWDCLVVSFVFSMNSFFTGIGNSMFTMVHNLISTFLVRIPVSWYLSRQPGTTLFHMGIAAPLATIVSVVICGVYLWKQRGVLSEKPLYLQGQSEAANG